MRVLNAVKPPHELLGGPASLTHIIVSNQTCGVRLLTSPVSLEEGQAMWQPTISLPPGQWTFEPRGLYGVKLEEWAGSSEAVVTVITFSPTEVAGETPGSMRTQELVLRSLDEMLVEIGHLKMLASYGVPVSHGGSA